jgi:hypothetical protein
MIAAMSVMTRQVELADAEAIAALDSRYAARRGVAAIAERAVVSYYSRSGHAFVRDADGDVLGFVLAHAVWDGGRPVVRLSRLVAEGDAPQVLRGLLDAFVKSAYDAGAYDLVAELPVGDEAGLAALREVSFAPREVVQLERTLGTRGAGAT